MCVSCAALGFAREAREVDHIVPLFRGGTDDPSNLQPLCAQCHADKSRADIGLRARSRSGVDGFPLNAAHHWGGHPNA
ncbi:MAG: HNH endonuclease [Gammaproteobacteria bacterium]|nr:HNH endonuclease [Gammaproteobacteria bacterium]